MKLEKTASGSKKITMSKKEWLHIGSKTGWLKKAQSENIEELHSQYRNQMQGGKPVYVSLYEIEKCYGGPEEGGWWYDRYTLLSTKKFFDEEEANNFCEALNKEVDDAGENKEPISSSRGLDQYPDPSRGDPMYDHSDADIPVGFAGLASNQRAYVEEVAGEMETKETPHWE